MILHISAIVLTLVSTSQLYLERGGFASWRVKIESAKTRDNRAGMGCVQTTKRFHESLAVKCPDLDLDDDIDCIEEVFIDCLFQPNRREWSRKRFIERVRRGISQDH